MEARPLKLAARANQYAGDAGRGNCPTAVGPLLSAKRLCLPSFSKPSGDGHPCRGEHSLGVFFLLARYATSSDQSLHGIRSYLNQVKQDTSGRIRLAPILLPVAHCANRQMERVGKLSSLRGLRPATSYPLIDIGLYSSLVPYPLATGAADQGIVLLIPDKTKGSASLSKQAPAARRPAGSAGAPMRMLNISRCLIEGPIPCRPDLAESGQAAFSRSPSKAAVDP